MSAIPTSTETLPARTPDLIIAQGSGGRWQVVTVSPEFSSLAEAALAAGRRQEELLQGTTPALEELAREALERESPLSGIRVRFPGLGDRVLDTDVFPGGLTEDFSARLVNFTFRPLPTEEEGGETFHGMVGGSSAMRELFRRIERYAPTDAAVVVTGETGSGKELVAQALHRESDRSAGPLVAVNCSAISEELLESELFGHEKGAFTGAVRTHLGRFERADGGTLFLDEIGDMPLVTQAKLLRVLEQKRVERVGGEREHPVDVRVVCATHVSLERAVAQGRFRSDLYHRLSVLRLRLPPLRERREDIPLLVEHFLQQFNRKYGRDIRRLTREALQLLQSYLWPGNIRELRNVLERVYIETGAEVIGVRAFAEWVRERQEFSPGEWGVESAERRGASLAPPYPLATEHPLLESSPRVLEAQLVPESPPKRSTQPADLEIDQIRSAYRASGGNLTAAARLLGVHRATLYRYLEKLGLSRSDLEG